MTNGRMNFESPEFLATTGDDDSLERFEGYRLRNAPPIEIPELEIQLHNTAGSPFMSVTDRLFAALGLPHPGQATGLLLAGALFVGVTSTVLVLQPGEQPHPTAPVATADSRAPATVDVALASADRTQNAADIERRADMIAAPTAAKFATICL
eukprot:gene29799-33600_t